MDNDDIQFLAATAWLFVRHGRSDRARPLLEALLEERGAEVGVAAAMLAEIELDEGDAEKALITLRGAKFPRELERAEALLETRALKMLGRQKEAENRWLRYVEAAKGANRKWVS